jgi:acetyl esterase/lipase
MNCVFTNTLFFVLGEPWDLSIREAELYSNADFFGEKIMDRKNWMLMFALLSLSSIAAAQVPAARQAPLANVSSSVQPKVSYPHDVEGLLDITYSTVMGYRPLKLDLYHSTTAKELRPAVIFLHGGGWFVGSPRMVSPVFGEKDQALAALAARGYVTIGATYRLSGEARFPAAIEDVKAAIRWTRANAAKYGIDPKRVALWGESAGAYLAILGGTSCGVAALEGKGGNPEQSSCVQAVVDFYGPNDFAQMDSQNRPDAQIRHSAADSPESKFLGCSLPECPKELLQLASPLTSIKADTPPFLIMHGDVDTAVPIQQSRLLRDALKAKGVPVTLVEVPGVNHGFAGATAEQGRKINEQLYKFLDTTFGVHGT